jgi:hypothetical protein
VNTSTDCQPTNIGLSYAVGLAARCDHGTASASPAKRITCRSRIVVASYSVIHGTAISTRSARYAAVNSHAHTGCSFFDRGDQLPDASPVRRAHWQSRIAAHARIGNGARVTFPSTPCFRGGGGLRGDNSWKMLLRKSPAVRSSSNTDLANGAGQRLLWRRLHRRAPDLGYFSYHRQSPLTESATGFASDRARRPCTCWAVSPPYADLAVDRTW